MHDPDTMRDSISNSAWSVVAPLPRSSSFKLSRSSDAAVAPVSQACGVSSWVLRVVVAGREVNLAAVRGGQADREAIPGHSGAA